MLSMGDDLCIAVILRELLDAMPVRRVDLDLGENWTGGG
jgi:hypothetical protein